jgi:acetyl-CoA synthetase (ADP-forming)
MAGGMVAGTYCSTSMSTTLSEAESKARLAAHGLPLVPERLCADADEAVAAAEELGYPVVAKLCGDNIAHKTERGLVRLRLADGDAVRSAATDLLAAGRPEDGVTGVLVAAMARGNRELIAGLHRDPQFGMTVMLGVGGILAEAVQDVAFRMVPITRTDAEELIGDLATQRLLGEFRGEPAVDRGALVDVLMALSDLATDDPAVAAVDVNPLVVVDGRPLAVDALVEVEG